MNGASSILIAEARRAERGFDSGVSCPSSPIDHRISGLSPLPSLVAHGASQNHRLHFPLACPRKDYLLPLTPPLHDTGILAPLSDSGADSGDWLGVRTMLGWVSMAAATQTLNFPCARA